MKYDLNKAEIELKNEVKEGRITLAQGKWLLLRMREKMGK